MKGGELKSIDSRQTVRLISFRSGVTIFGKFCERKGLGVGGEKENNRKKRD